MKPAAGHLADVIPINRAAPPAFTMPATDLPPTAARDPVVGGVARPFPFALVLAALRALALGICLVGCLCVMAGALVVVSMDRR